MGWEMEYTSPKVSIVARHREPHPRGAVLTGFRAYRRIALRMPGAAWLAPLLYLPGVAWVGERVYRRIAPHQRIECAAPAAK